MAGRTQCQCGPAAAVPSDDHLHRAGDLLPDLHAGGAGCPLRRRPHGHAARGVARRPGRCRRHGQRRPAVAGRGVGPRGAPAELLPLESFIVPAEALFGSGMVASLRVRHPGRANARVEASPLLGSRIALTKGEAAVFDGVSGKLLQAPAEKRPSALTQRVMAGLHFAQFGGYPMRWLYFLCSAVSCAMIATGLVLFVIRQRLKVAEANAGQGFLRLVETLNVGTLAGLMLGCVALLWAARLLPADLAGRAGWEARLFFAVWALAFVHAWRRPPMAAWREQLWAAALLCMGLPLLEGFSAPSLDKTRLLLELCVFLCGAVLGWVAWRVGKASAADGVSRSLEGAMRC
ncbi:PepSY domain-containing protein [Azotobacter chroococcum]